MIIDQILVKVSSMKRVIRFGKIGKLSLSFISPFEVFKKNGDVV